MRVAAMLGWVTWSTAPAQDVPERSADLRLEIVARGLSDPLYLTAPAGDARLFVVEQAGRIRIVKDGRLLPAPFLDLRDSVGAGGERGLLGLAFHPVYARNGRFYVDYTDKHGDTRIKRFAVSGDPDRADPASGTQLLFIAQPYANHNGGLVMFGPDGMLYVGWGTGDRAGTHTATARSGARCSASCCASTSTVATRTRSPPTIRFWGPRARAPRSGPPDCATRGASHSTG